MQQARHATSSRRYLAAGCRRWDSLSFYAERPPSDIKRNCDIDTSTRWMDGDSKQSYCFRLFIPKWCFFGALTHRQTVRYRSHRQTVSRPVRRSTYGMVVRTTDLRLAWPPEEEVVFVSSFCFGLPAAAAGDAATLRWRPRGACRSSLRSHLDRLRGVFLPIRWFFKTLKDGPGSSECSEKKKSDVFALSLFGFLHFLPSFGHCQHHSLTSR